MKNEKIRVVLNCIQQAVEAGEMTPSVAGQISAILEEHLRETEESTVRMDVLARVVELLLLETGSTLASEVLELIRNLF